MRRAAPGSAGRVRRRQVCHKAPNISPSVAYNQQLISKYDGAMNALATEMSKWEEKPGDAQKSVDEMQKGLDKALADAKKSQ